MDYSYMTQGFIVHPHQHSIEIGQRLLQVRPKTFALLLLLLNNPREVLSKRYLLDSIWDDVKVEEQVLVQSIRELRQLFGSPEIIQTYPRKGYSWSAPVEKIYLEEQFRNSPTEPPPETPQSTALVTAQPTRRQKKPTILIALIVLISAISICAVSISKTPITHATEVIMILPMKNKMLGNDHNWVSLGSMDQLTHLLILTDTVQVMPTEYVLQIMQYAKLPRNYNTEQVGKIFDHSGATLIVESQLSGTVENYRLDYKLREIHSSKRGVIFDSNLNQAIHQLAKIISVETGQQLVDAERTNADSNAQTTLTNELMARALEKLDQNELEPAFNFLSSLRQLDPKNMAVNELLIKVLIRLKRLGQAKTLIKQTLSASVIADEKHFAKIHYLSAKISYEQQKYQQTLDSLGHAANIAAVNNDILLLAMVNELQGQTQQKRGAYDLAQIAYEKAMRYDVIINCPIGITANNLHLAEIFLLQNNHALAVKHHSQAKKIIDLNQLHEFNQELGEIKL